MITGAHILVYTSNPDADRAFLRDALEIPSIDIGGGWLIFGLPPAELACHPSDEPSESARGMASAHLYFMCDDLHAQVAALAKKNVACTEIATERWGIRTTIRMPSGAELGLYQPTHPTALHLTARPSRE
jgi:hypothetical protein